MCSSILHPKYHSFSRVLCYVNAIHTLHLFKVQTEIKKGYCCNAKKVHSEIKISWFEKLMPFYLQKSTDD